MTVCAWIRAMPCQSLCLLVHRGRPADNARSTSRAKCFRFKSDIYNNVHFYTLFVNEVIRVLLNQRLRERICECEWYIIIQLSPEYSIEKRHEAGDIKGRYTFENCVFFFLSPSFAFVLLYLCDFSVLTFF